MPAKLPKFIFVCQPVYMEFDFDNVLQDGLHLKSFLCFLQHPTCVVLNSVKTHLIHTISTNRFPLLLSPC